MNLSTVESVFVIMNIFLNNTKNVEYVNTRCLGKIHVLFCYYICYEENRKQRMGITDDTPKKFKYKKLVV